MEQSSHFMLCLANFVKMNFLTIKFQYQRLVFKVVS